MESTVQLFQWFSLQQREEKILSSGTLLTEVLCYMIALFFFVHLPHSGVEVKHVM